MAQATSTWIVIGNNTVQLKANRQQLIRIFMMQRLVDDQGQPLRLYSFVPEDERFLAFVSQCLRWPPQVIARRWRRNLTTGEGTTPYFVDTESQIRENVSKYAGGLGYLPAEQLSEDANYKVIYQCKE